MIRVQHADQPVVADPKPRVKQVQVVKHDPVPLSEVVKQARVKHREAVKHDPSVKQLIGVRVPGALLAKIDARAKVLGLNRSQTVLDILRDALK